MKQILGDNQFFGVNHNDIDKGDKTKILFSDNEAVPIAMIEAGLAGLPVIATNVGSMSDVVENGINGFLVDPIIDEIASKVKVLSANKP